MCTPKKKEKKHIGFCLIASSPSIRKGVAGMSSQMLEDLILQMFSNVDGFYESEKEGKQCATKP